MKYTALTLSFFSLLVIFQNTSCTRGNKYLKETQMLDSMQTFVVKADSAVKTIDSAQITGYVHQVEKDDEMMQMEHIDSISPGATSIFRSFNIVRWSLLSVAGKRGPLITELKKSEQQMKQLSHDLKHNLLNADSVSYYVAYETKKASELIQVSDISVSEVKKQVPVYMALLPKTDSLMSLVKEHKKF
jgi:hypothetical protein